MGAPMTKIIKLRESNLADIEYAVRLAILRAKDSDNAWIIPKFEAALRDIQEASK